MADLKVQHICIKSCFKPGKNATETFDMRKVALESRQWEEHKFLNGFSKSSTYVTSLEDAERLGLPSMVKTDANVYQVKERNLKNRRITICEVANISGI
jgi:predicted TIM-barrel fold metal-dependent hydrolase